MSYVDQAEKINQRMREIFATLEGDKTSPMELYKAKADLVDAMLWFGQVAKFRCRSNTAYDNFATLVLKDIAKVQRQQIPGQEFEALLVKRE